MNSVNRKLFLVGEFMNFSITAGFATRNEEFPVYDLMSDYFNLKVAKSLKADIKNYLLEYYSELSKSSVTEGEHKKRIRSLANNITRRYKKILNRGKFRIGVAQKIANLFIKYLWAAGLINEPHHCPFDNIVKRKIQKYSENKWLVDWTEMTTMKEYEEYVYASQEAGNIEKLSIAAWEMKHWKRR